jgi:Family of unknown function (DUF5691)
MSNVLNTALLGTEKLPFQTDNLPKSIAAYLAKAPAADSPETAFLRAATLLKAYHKAGENPEKLIVPVYALAPEEIRNYCPNEIAQHFKAERDAMETSLLAMAMSKCAAKNWALPPAALINLLEIGSNKANFRLFGKKIIQIAGEKGQWLAQFNPDWNYLLSESENEENTWAEGKLDARLHLFKNWRKTNPVLALEQITAAWASLSAKERKTFLEAMQPEINAADEAFLEMAYEEVMKQKENDKGIKAELKTELVNLLIAIPNSKKQNWIFEQITPYFTKKKTLMGFGKSEIVLDLPIENDAFFCPDVQVSLLGRSKNNQFLAWRSDAENWFCELLSYLPPHRFAEFLEVSPNDLMPLFGNDFKGKIKTKQPFAATTFGAAIAHSKTQELAFLYLNALPQKEEDNVFKASLPALFALLSDSEMDIVLTKNQANLSLSLLAEALPQRVWSSFTTAHFLKLCTEEVAGTYYTTTVKQTLAQALPFLSADAFQKFNRTIDTMTFKSHSEQQKIIDTIHLPLQVFFGRREAMERL